MSVATQRRTISRTNAKHWFLVRTRSWPYSAAPTRASPPEYAFDTVRGDLFAIRVAGNFVTDEGLASLEYGVAVLGAPLILVLGHERCGAIEAAVKAVKDRTVFPGQIPKLTNALQPSIEQVLKQPGDLVANATAQNVKNSVERLKAATPLLTDALGNGKLKIVGGLYRLATGKVELIA